jgi:predicted lipoprotein with Yx(FWY)xxD motif
MKRSLARISGAAVAGVAALAFAAACSSSPSTPSAASSSSAPTTAASSGAAAAVGIMTTSAPGLGTILVDSTGRTIYRYDKDTNNPPTSNCGAGCDTAWPPVPATTNVTGVASSLVGSVTRSDGTKQLTIGGWPVYYYAGDSSAGQVNGQGSGGVWWVVAPSGSEVKTSGATSSSASSGGGGY